MQQCSFDAAYAPFSLSHQHRFKQYSIFNNQNVATDGLRVQSPCVKTTCVKKAGNCPIANVYRRHYENTPIPIYRKFYLQKLKIFR